MGNISSCYSGGNSKSKVEMAKIIDSQGTLQVVEAPLTAAEVMLEYPGYVVSPVDELRRTRRIIVMKAEETLVGRRFYLLVPVGKVNCKNITESQMSLVDSVCRKKRRSRGSSKVSPAVVSDHGGVGGERVVERSCAGKGSVGGGRHRLRHVRPWTPVLEPILEGC